MKKIIITVLLILCIAFLSGCSTERVHSSRFKPIKEYRDCYIYYDVETGVEYMGAYSRFSVLLDEDGKPIIYEEAKGDKND